MRKNMKQVGMAGLLISVGVLGRIYLRPLLPNLPHMTITINGVTQPVFIADMFFIVAIVSLLSGILLKGYYTIIIPVMVMLITDVFYGNGYIFLFTWSGFAFISLIAHASSKKLVFNGASALKVMGIGIGGVLLYDAWTNFGWWIGPYYPHTVDGLALCYTLAIPFTVWHVLSTGLVLMVIAPVVLYFKDATMQLSSKQPLEKYMPLAASLLLAAASLLMAL